MLDRRFLVSAAIFVVVGFSGTQAQQTKALFTAQDYIDITQLYAAYNNAIDGGYAEKYADLFTPDGAFNDLVGREALVAFVKRRGETTQRHWNANLTITPTPEGANGTVYLLLVDVAAKPPAIALAASYVDTLVKTSDGWRFKKRHVTGP